MQRDCKVMQHNGKTGCQLDPAHCIKGVQSPEHLSPEHLPPCPGGELTAFVQLIGLPEQSKCRITDFIVNHLARNGNLLLLCRQTILFVAAAAPYDCGASASLVGRKKWSVLPNQSICRYYQI